MPKKTTAIETVAAVAPRVTKPKAPRKTAATEVTAAPRVKSVKHSKASVPVAVVEVSAPEVVAAAPVNATEQIAKIAYGYFEARGYQHGFAEQDWLRAEQEYLGRA